VEINEIGTERTIESISETKNWFIERISKFENSLPN
jgi:hypothetical protein